MEKIYTPPSWASAPKRQRRAGAAAAAAEEEEEEEEEEQRSDDEYVYIDRQDVVMEIFKGGVETNQFIILADCVWRPEMAMSGNDEKEEELLAGDASCIVCGRAPFPFIQQEQWKQESQSHQNGVCRTWNNYILLEHQSISRNHCVIQFGMGKEGFVQLYLYDLGSTHGTFLNKQKLKPREYYKYNDGDLVIFGESSRMYLLHNESQRRREIPIRQEAVPARKHAINSRTKGDDDAHEEEEEEEEMTINKEDELLKCMTYDDDDNFDWRSYKGPITEKQERSLSKIREKDYKIKNMMKEIESIQAKRYTNSTSRRFEDDAGGDGLSDGQRNQILRNNQHIDKLQEEIDGMVFSLEESIKDSILGRSKLRKDRDQMLRKRAYKSHNEYDSDDDDFYDRTGPTKRNKPNSREKRAGDDKDSGALHGNVETVETLWMKREECERLIEELEGEKRRAQKGKGIQGNDNNNSNESEAKQQSGNDDDVLDAYMMNISKKVHDDSMTSLEKQLDEQRKKLERLCHLINIADPEALYVHKISTGKNNGSSSLSTKGNPLSMIEPKSVSVAKMMAANAYHKSKY